MWYDFAVAGILLFCLVRGMSKGFVWQLAALGSVVLCFAFAETASLAIAPYLNVQPPLNRWVSMLLLYVACSFVCFALARGLKSTLEKRQFDDYDRHLGGLFGVLKGAGLAVVVTFFAVTLSDKLRPTVLRSYSGHAAAVVMNQFAPLFPEGLGRYIEPYLNNYEGLDEDPVGPHLVEGADDPGDDFFGDGSGGPAGDDRDDADATGGGAFGDFGWDDDPAAEQIARGSGTSGDQRGGRGDASFGDSLFGDGPAGGFGDDPGGAGGTRGGWLNDDGGLNTDRLAGEAARFGRGVLNDVPADTRDRLGRDLADSARRRFGDEVDRRVGDLFGDAPGGSREASPDAAAPSVSRSQILDRIAARYAPDDLAARDLFRRRAEQMLRPVPEGVAGDVLRDWLHDLRAGDGDPAAGTDPNPDTTVQTLLPDRIRRGLAARVAGPAGDRPPR